MKKTIRILISLTALILMAAGSAAAQSTFGNVVSVDKVNHDFGDIFTDQGPVNCTYTFTNISNKPILLLQAVSSCGCTTTEWPRAPIQPGKTGTVKAEFDNNDGPTPSTRPSPYMYPILRIPSCSISAVPHMTMPGRSRSHTP